mmetsp:Transcript_40224/g.61389  ORF Transcript_40224/g.61389 Transcript_40224/m.61389 type:complete len:131 (+) Transcript_40224:211-603(+)
MGSNIQALEKELDKVTAQAYFHAILSATGKALLAVVTCWPLPSFFMAAASSKMDKRERVSRVEVCSWKCLLLALMNYSVWTSYAFKVQSVEIALISVTCLLINVLLLALYLVVKPEQQLTIQFFGVLIFC